MIMFCDSAVERYVRKEYYDHLKSLSTTARFSEKFRLETELLNIDIKDNDEIAGWFCFDKECDEYTVFPDEQLSAETQKIIEAPSEFGSRTNVDRGHTLIDYECVLNNGLEYYERQINAELEKNPENEYLKAMKDTLTIALKFFEHIADAINEKLENCDTHNAIQLEKLKKLAEKVPYRPAEDFREAVQSVWFMHFLLPLAENAWYSISLGRFDLYMYPFYKKSIDNGMTRNDVKKILRNFYELLNSYADGACLLNIGPEYNELSELIIECQKEFKMPAPILGARVDRNTYDKIWESLIDIDLFSMGQPTFYGEKACMNALTEKGIDVDDIMRYANNSCMGIGIPGKEFNSMWGCVFMVSSALEAAMNCGKIFESDKLHIPDITIPQNIEKLFENFEKCAEYLLKVCVNSYEMRAKTSETLLPDPFLSLLTCDCIKRHCDRISGARYHNVTFECMGMINVSDGLFAINRLVFEEKKYTIEKMNTAVRSNFTGYESLRREIMKCPKFGEGNGAESYAVKVAEILQKLIRGFDHDNLYYSPSLHTLDSNVGYGACHGAGYDGRLAGEPFAKNAGASNVARKSVPTSMVLASSELPQSKFFGGQPIDVSFSHDMVETHKKAIQSFIKIYFERGGLQFQVNSISAAILREAMNNPESFPNLVVRIGGYSEYFSRLSKKSQAEFVERLEKEGL
mgnify:CR=1 FL=1